MSGDLESLPPGKTPEPGIYEGVKFADYLRWDAVSNSKLSLMAKSPLHYKRGFCREPSPAMQLGAMYHCGVLEPLMFADRYAISPDFHLDAHNCTTNGAPSKSTTTKWCKDRMEEFTAMSEGREIVPRDWYQSTLSLVKQLHANETSRNLLNSAGPTEVSIVWEDDGILCKARLDKVAYSLGISDLKSTAQLDKFTRAIGSYGYHRQMAHYQAGWKELTGDTLDCWLIAAESDEPYAVQAAPLSEEALSIGQSARTKLMNDVRDCLESNSWPGPPNPKHWNVPEWAIDQSPVGLVVNGQTIEV